MASGQCVAHQRHCQARDRDSPERVNPRLGVTPVALDVVELWQVNHPDGIRYEKSRQRL